MNPFPRRVRPLLPLAICLLAVAAAQAAVRLPPWFSDGAVLQRGQANTIWGWASAGEKVRVAFHAQEVETTADAEGRWRVVLKAEAPTSVAAPLRVTGDTTLVLQDVVVGDVWICAGQSNMEAVVANALAPAREIAAANFPAIRQIKIARQLSEAPKEEVGATAWVRAVPEQVGRFSAVGYFFAREFFRKTGVPVGLVNCTWSGTPIEPWISGEILARDPAFAPVAARWKTDLAAYPERRAAFERALADWKKLAEAEQRKSPEAHRAFLSAHRAPRPPSTAPDHPYPSNPSAIYNGMVHPLRQAAVRGVLWYQGEANAVRAGEYAALFRASIGGWRTAFGQPEMPFYWVQIANFLVDTDWPGLREAQAAALTLPATGQAVTIDIGDPHDIHPSNKQEVGRRLALIALAQLEKRAVEHHGPSFSGVEFAKGVARVSFRHAAGLHTRSGAAASLEVAGEDRVFHAAEGRIDSEGLLVSSPAVPQPIAVRYAWKAAPQANLYNLAGLPAAPFRSDAW
ncbi:MAG: sialate O-acetylesterase [Verrucomicrobiota bacterium]